MKRATDKQRQRRRYVSRAIKRQRRTLAEMDELLAAIHSILDGEEHPITVRHLFYRLVGLGVIPKTEGAYHLLVRHLSRWRRSGEIPWDGFADSTRWHIQAPTFDGVADALQRTRETYRRDLWSTQPYYVELWIEKDAIASIVADVANDFGVPVFVCRGFASLSSLYSAAQTFRDAEANGKRVTIFHLGDYDPSGHAAGDAIERTLIEDFDCELNFERLAILPGQITRLNLPTRPTKQTDTRARNWGDESVELDAMSPSDMRELVEDAITDLIDPGAWNQLKKIEKAERESLAKIRVA
jgi:hypothetical protein